MIFSRVIFYKVAEMVIDSFFDGIIKNFEKHTGRQMLLSEAKAGYTFSRLEMFNDCAFDVLVESIDNIGFKIRYKYSQFIEKDDTIFIWTRSNPIPQDILIDISNYLETQYSKEYIKETMFISSAQFILPKDVVDKLNLRELLERNITTKITHFEASNAICYF